MAAKAKQNSISMTSRQSQRLADLALKLGMSKSKTVNSLIYAASKIDVLQDIIKYIDSLPEEWKKQHLKAQNKLYKPIREKVIEQCEQIKKWIDDLPQIFNDYLNLKMMDREHIIQIVKTHWVDEQEY